MNARDQEAHMLQRCHDAIFLASAARDAQEANVFRLASMVAKAHFPEQARMLMLASDNYLKMHPAEKLGSEGVVRRGWVQNVPRFRDMLTLKLLDKKA